MRASILILVIAVAGSQALFLEDFKDIGKNLVDKLVDTGKEAAGKVLTDLTGSALEALSKLGDNSLVGKRDALTMKEKAKAWAKKWHDLLESRKQMAAAAYKKAMDRLKAVMKKFHETAVNKLQDSKAKDAVDDVVAEHHVEHKRILGDLLAKAKELLSNAVSTAKVAAQGVLSKLKEQASGLVSSLLQQGANVLVGKRLLIGKRATLSDHLQTLGSALSSALSPFKDIVAGLGNTLKGHFSNLVDTVKGHAQALKGKLSGHVDDLKAHGAKLLDHGKNALGALGEVASDILKQTLNNASPHLDGLAKTVADAGNTVLNHFGGKN